MNIEQLSALLGESISSENVLAWLHQFTVSRSSVDLSANGNRSVEEFLSDTTKGLQVCLSETKRVSAIFLMGDGYEGYTGYPYALDDGLNFDSTRKDIEGRFGEPSWSRPARTIPILGAVGAAIRYDYPEYSLHFEFDSAKGGLAKVSIFKRNAALQAQS